GWSAGPTGSPSWWTADLRPPPRSQERIERKQTYDTTPPDDRRRAAPRRLPAGAGEGRDPRQPAAQAARGRDVPLGHRRLRRHGGAADRERAARAPELHPAGPARPGEEPDR